MELKDYNEALSKHDWRFEFSDDQRVWRSGSDREKFLRSISILSRRHLLLWEAWQAWSWITLRSVQPEVNHAAKRDEVIKTVLAEQGETT